MVFAFTWAWRNATSFVDFGAGNLIGFYGGATYGTKTRVGNYQTHNHVRTASGTDTDACASPHMDSIQYVAAATCQINQGGVVNVSTIATTDCVRITFTDGATSISTENAKFFAFDGSVDANAPTGVTCQALEQGDAAWSDSGANVNGSAAAIGLADQATPAVSKVFYVAMSATPSAVGEKLSFAWKITVDYY